MEHSPSIYTLTNLFWVQNFEYQRMLEIKVDIKNEYKKNYRFF